MAREVEPVLTEADEKGTARNPENLLSLAENVESGGPEGSHTEGRMLVLSDGSRWGPFTSSWAAVAAMIRLSDPGFVSLGGDKAIDLAIESDIRSPAAQEGGR